MNRRRPVPLISGREWRMFWMITGGLVVISGGVTALATWLGRPEEPKYLLPSQSPFKKGVADTIQKTIMLSDLDLPAPGGEWLSKSWLYSRTGGGRPWTMEEVSPFWIPPNRLEILQLPANNANKLDRLFNGVP